MTELRAARIFARCGGHCAICQRRLGPADDWDVDHILALENGGTDDDENLQIACCWCHDPKTAQDHRTASKGKRRFAKHYVPRRFKQSNGWGRR